jgi:hypothetical protein
VGGSGGGGGCGSSLKVMQPGGSLRVGTWTRGKNQPNYFVLFFFFKGFPYMSPGPGMFTILT